GTLRIGAVTLPNATTSTTATSIAIAAGGLSVTGNLALQTSGNISETTGGLSVTGTSSFTSTTAGGTITLDNARNHLGGAITFSTIGPNGNVVLVNGNATVLTAQTVNGDLTVTDADSIIQTGPLTV